MVAAGMKKTVLLVLLGIIICVITSPFLDRRNSYTALPPPRHDLQIPPNCTKVYDDDGGGAPAVFDSPECPDWVLSSHQQETTLNCQFSTTQGRRNYQEDRVSCDLHINMPFIIGKKGVSRRVGVAAVFDGHIGTEASEMASKLFLDYFYLHSAFLAYKINNADEANYMDILKEALVRTIHDIDAAFTKEAYRFQLYAGSTAVIAVVVDGHILVANVGDSKALLCSQKILSDPSGKDSLFSHLLAKELTIDHNLYRVEERSRIEAAGGRIYEQHDPPLVNGHFPMTRAIGDVPLKRYGIIPVPEVTDWQPINANDIYLVVASDGIFESLEPQSVCDLLPTAHSKEQDELKPSSLCLSFSSLAECIVHRAFEKGSRDNLSTVVLPLPSSGFYLEKSEREYVI